MSEEALLAFGVWCGLDVGKQAHHACALDPAGKRLFDVPLPRDQHRLEDLFVKLRAHGRVLVIVDQPNTIGALPIAVARSMGIEGPGWRCVGSRTSIPAARRLMPAMLT